MENTYQLGPIAISKSFVKQPFFWPGVIGVVVVILAVIAVSSGSVPFPTTSPIPTPTLKAQVFPLNQQFNRPILYSAGTTIFRSNGQSEERLYEVGSEVLSLIPSNDGSRLAATYKHPRGGMNANGYPYTSLIFWDMNTQRSLPIIALENTTVRYAQWSDDARYLAFWVNEGEESFIYDTSRRRASFSVKRESSSAVSPIVFLPGTSGIVYIKNSTLYSAAVDGTRPIALAERAAATRSVGGAIVASPPVVSPNGAHLAFYTISGDLAVVNTTTREVKTVGANLTSLGFLSNDELLYMADADSKEKAPAVFRFTIADAKSTRLLYTKGFLAKGAWPQAAVVIPSKSQLFMPSTYPNLGPQLLNKDGVIEKDCSVAEFQYGYNNSSNDTMFPQTAQVVSLDNKYLLGLSGNSLAVMDTATCQPYIITQTKPTAMTWMW
jgi:hypothetical protein